MPLLPAPLSSVLKDIRRRSENLLLLGLCPRDCAKSMDGILSVRTSDSSALSPFLSSFEAISFKIH